MFFHYLVHSSDCRIAKKILLEPTERKHSKCWFEELQPIARKNEIGIETNIVNDKIVIELKPVSRRDSNHYQTQTQHDNVKANYKNKDNNMMRDVCYEETD